MMKLFNKLALLTPALFLVACGGEKHSEATARYNEDYAKLRSELADYSKLIPQQAVPAKTVPALDPLPEYRRAKLMSNTSIIMFEQLTNPEFDFGNDILNPSPDDKFDFDASNNLVRNLRWTGPADPRTDYLKNKSADDRLEREMQYPLNLRYLVVVKTRVHKKPVVQNKDSFAGGHIILDLFVIDRDTKALVTQSAIVAQNGKTVNFKYAEESDPTKALLSGLYGELDQNVRSITIAKLEEMTGGKFK